MANDIQTSTKIDGVIEAWLHHPNGSIYGQLVEDHKGRFPKDSWIITSTVTEIKDGIAKTLNSTYKLGEPYVYPE